MNVTFFINKKDLDQLDRLEKSIKRGEELPKEFDYSIEAFANQPGTGYHIEVSIEYYIFESITN